MPGQRYRLTRPPTLFSPPAFGPRILRADAARALAPHWPALLALALFLIAGLAALDDYGVTGDETSQQRNVRANVRFVAGDEDALPTRIDQFFGMGFEAGLLLAEQSPGLDHFRGVFLVRHLLTHLSFLTGGLFAYLLARRLFASRLLPPLAMALFLLHPRLYAHAFFNSKDIPFLALFMVALFLAHRAFRRDTVIAFLLLGVAVGALVHLRIMGVVLLAAVPAMRALDFALARDWAERKRILITTCAFALSGALAIYALLPHLWADPVGRSIEWWATLANHPDVHYELFRGAIRVSSDLPADYLPVWFSITTPPFALLLGLTGAASILVGAAAAAGEGLRNKRLRFGLLLVGCFALPVFAVAFLGSNAFNGWRHLYFLWAPFSLLAVFGLRWLASALRLPRLRTAAYGAAGAGLAATLASMALLHPNEQVYFNALVDRVQPERLRMQYPIDYWSHPVRQAWELLLAERPFSVAEANTAGYHSRHTLEENALILPRASRERTSLRPTSDALVMRDGSEADLDRAVHSIKVYGSTMLTIERKDDLRATYAEAADGDLILDSVFDFRRIDGALAVVKEPCAPSFITDTVFRLRIYPADADDLPYWRAGEDFEVVQFQFAGHGALFDGKCVARLALPDYPIADFGVRWDRQFLDEDAARDAAAQAVESGRLLARSLYDVYLASGDADELVYIQEPCDPAGTESRFFLHIVPERESDLPRERRSSGFDNFGFDFHANGALLEDKCVAVAALPPYPIARVRTGQFVSGAGDIWRTEFALGR